MRHEVKVVIGANYGDEGKGLVSCQLAKDALDRGNKVLTVLFNGGAQRGHTAYGKVHHTTGAAVDLGVDTFYAPRFMLDPIALWLSEQKVYIDPLCRVVLPVDVVKNRYVEDVRGGSRHGSCGMGIFQACKRNGDPNQRLLAKELFDSPLKMIGFRLKQFNERYGAPHDIVYNNSNFMEAVRYMRNNCICKRLDDIKSMYQTVIFEGGQGLLLDQGNKGGFPNLTPSSTGARNTIGLIQQLGGRPDVYYVSRTYMTRHGAGKMLNECPREEINPEIVDETNVQNHWQGSLRFGYLSPVQLEHRIRRDSLMFDGLGGKTINLVFTHGNYTGGKLAVGKDERAEIIMPKFVDRLWISEAKDEMRREI